MHGIVRLDRQCEWLIDGYGFEVRDQVTVRRHGAQHLFRDLRHVDRSVDLRHVVTKLWPFEADEMIHVDVRDEKHRARVVVALERIDRNKGIFFQYSMVGAHTD